MKEDVCKLGVQLFAFNCSVEWLMCGVFSFGE